MSQREAAVVERLKSVPQVAKLAGVSRSTMRRKLLKLHEERPGAWLKRRARGKYEVNLSMLKVAHPELFEQTLASRSEVEDLREQVGDLRKHMNSLEYRLRKFREQAHAHFKAGANGGKVEHSNPSL